jgi:uncharacterized protein
MSLRRIYIVPVILLVLLTSCGTYNMQVSDYYGHLKEGNYDKAAKALDKNKLLKKNRNYLLYLLERGKMSHLLHQWDSSNAYFNEADRLMESAGASAKDIILGSLMNPMMESYKAEDFEKYLVHYYKALNYLQLSNAEEAMVEARRISLRAYTQEDKAGKNKYGEDAFSFMLQGMIYEKNQDINNAFIAYRNAVDVYLQHNGDYYGTRIPEQLKKDLLRTAHQNGFTDELQRYETLMGTTYTNETAAEGGELILFWENGSAPVKAQQDIWFTLTKGDLGNFFFTDGGNNYNIPFDVSSGYNTGSIKLEDLRSFRVALPKYQSQALIYSGASVQSNNATYSLEAAENINTLAFTTLKERMVRELSSALTRLAIKKLAEAAIRPKDKDDDDKKGKSEEEKKKDKKKENTREAIALGMQIFNFVSEKANTRNWQSLPHTIYYTRIPLQKGENKIQLQLDGKSSPAIEIAVNGTGKLQFHNVCTPK